MCHTEAPLTPALSLGLLLRRNSSLAFNLIRMLSLQVDPSIRLDWGSGVPAGVSRVGSTGGSVGVRWDGFLKVHLSGAFTFTITMGAGDEAR